MIYGGERAMQRENTLWALLEEWMLQRANADGRGDARAQCGLRRCRGLPWTRLCQEPRMPLSWLEVSKAASQNEGMQLRGESSDE